MTPLIPCHNPPASVGEAGRESVVGSSEIKAAVGQQQWWSVFVAPLIHSNPNARAVDAVLAIWGPYVQLLVSGHHHVVAQF